jgi:ribosomal protein L11 methyltransferase
MLELFAEGFEETDLAGEVELAAYTRTDWDRRLTTLGAVRVEPVAPGWEDAWKRFHRPVRIGRLWVGPPWERPDADTLAVVVDPGRAFGTGAHATTRLCLDLLLGCEPGSFADLGCGSGIVAIAAAKLGFSPVCAIDSDEIAVDTTRRNAAANDVPIDAHVGDVAIDTLPTVDVAVANIELALVERIAERVPAQALVTSGYLDSERPAVRSRRHRARCEADGWAADLFEAD